MVMSLRRFSDHRSEPLEQQPKNGLALALGPAPTLGVVVKDGAGGAAFKAASRTMIEFMHRGFDHGGTFRRHHSCQAFIQSAFKITDALFHCAVVAWKMRWIVQRQHAITGHDAVHLFIVKSRAVVTFEEQRRAILLKQTFEMSGLRQRRRNL